MRIAIAAVGRPRNAAIGAAISDYETRAARYWPLEVHEVREEKGGGSTAEVVREREGERLSAVIASTRVIACDQHGRSFTSEQFSKFVSSAREAGRDIAFVIGGAFGLSERILAPAELRLALSPWTLPHELARLVLAEQLYRAGTILRGEPYHK